MKKLDGIFINESQHMSDGDWEKIAKKLERKASGHPRLMPAFLCRFIGRFNRSLCRLHSDCESYRLGYRHKGANCECLKVQYEIEGDK